MNRNSARTALCALVCLLTACTGLTFGENQPGGDVFIDDLPGLAEGEAGLGSIAVHPDQDRAVILRAENVPHSTTDVRRVHAVDVNTGTVSPGFNVSSESDLRVTFPDSGYLLFSEQNNHDVLRRMDLATNRVLQTREVSVRYHGTRTSASRRWVAVADNTSAQPDIHIIDAHDLSTMVIPNDSEWLEAMWLNTRDELVVIAFYNMRTEDSYARILSWRISTLIENDFIVGDDGYWVNPEMDLRIDGADGDYLFSFSWIGVSPDDSQLVFPVVFNDYEASEFVHGYRLGVLDVATKEWHWVDDARGPVGYTPDGSTIVSYRYANDSACIFNCDDPSLVLIDAVTGDQRELPLPFDGGPSFFVSHAGHFVVATATLGGESLVLVDLDTERMTQLADGPQDLHEFTVRPDNQEMWIVDDGLYRVDIMSATASEMPLDFLPAHINILHDGRRILLTPSLGDGLRIYDTEATRVVDTISVR